MFSAKSSFFQTIRIPFPPPPLAALMITGKPHFSATAIASFSLSIAPSLPGVIGKPAFKAVVLA